MDLIAKIRKIAPELTTKQINEIIELRGETQKEGLEREKKPAEWTSPLPKEIWLKEILPRITERGTKKGDYIINDYTNVGGRIHHLDILVEDSYSGPVNREWQAKISLYYRFGYFIVDNPHIHGREDGGLTILSPTLRLTINRQDTEWIYKIHELMGNQPERNAAQRLQEISAVSKHVKVKVDKNAKN